MKYIVLVAVGLLWSFGGSTLEDNFPNEVAEFVRKARMPNAKFRSAGSLLHSLETIFSERWPGCEVKLLGSMAYRLDTTFSDMDCTINLPENNSTSNENLLAIVEEAQRLLQRHLEFENFNIFTDLAVPVLQFSHTPTNLNVDVSFNTYNEMQRCLLNKYLLQLDEKAYHLAFIVKYWARLCNKKEEYMLRNYGMIMLVVFYLQQRRVLPPIVLLQENATRFMIDEWDFGFGEIMYEAENNVSLSSLVGGFFKYYSEFDFDNFIVSPYAGYPIKKSVFKDLKTVPKEFVLYEKNVEGRISQPLQVSEGILIQDVFVQNHYIANDLQTQPGPSFRSVFEYAAKTFQKDKQNFLNNLK